jgi:hypothetical protein
MRIRRLLWIWRYAKSDAFGFAPEIKRPREH